MTEAERALVRLSALLGGRDNVRIREAMAHAAALNDGRAIEETLLQSYLFLGYPAALGALALWRERMPVPASEQAEDPATWQARGARVCSRVYGGQYERLRKNVARLHPDMERWMVVEGYGKVLGRAGLDLRVRELCVVALLVGQDAAPQLYAHLRGALNAGASTADVEEAVALAGAEAGPHRLEAASFVWRGLLERRATLAVVVSTDQEAG